MNCDHVFDVLTRGPFPRGDSTDPLVERHLQVCHDCRQLAEALRPAVTLLHECLESQEASELPGYRGMLDASFWEQQAAADLRPGSREAPASHRWEPAAAIWPDSAGGAPGGELPRIPGRDLDGGVVRPRRASRWLPGGFPSGVLAAGLISVALLGVGRALWSPTGAESPPAIGRRAGDFAVVPDERGSRLLSRLPLTALCRDLGRLATPFPAGSQNDSAHAESRFPHAGDGRGSSQAGQHAAAPPDVYVCCTLCHAAGRSVALASSEDGFSGSPVPEARHSSDSPPRTDGRHGADGWHGTDGRHGVASPADLPITSSLALATTLRSCEACHRTETAAATAWKLPSL